MKTFILVHGLHQLKKIKDSLIEASPFYNFRLYFIFVCVGLGYAFIIMRLMFLGFNSEDFQQKSMMQQAIKTQVSVNIEQKTRPIIYDRNGMILAYDLYKPSLYTKPRDIPNPEEIEDELIAIFPSLDRRVLRQKLHSDKTFVWLKRGLTKRQKEQVYNLGFPWLKFKEEIKRIYPNGRLLSHVLGYTNISNKGQDGIELYLDSYNTHIEKETKKDDFSIHLTIDARLNYIVQKELEQALKTYQAIGGAAIMMDIHSGEVLSFSSLPDFDPNHPVTALQPEAINRISRSRYELGSTIKPFTYAMFLEHYQQANNVSFDISQSLDVKGFIVKKSRKAVQKHMLLTEGFITSNNIVASQIALALGHEKHLKFLKDIGLTQSSFKQFPSSVKTSLPKKWNEVSSVSSAFGYGIAISPLRYASSMATLLNGGYEVEPLLIKSNKAYKQAKKIDMKKKKMNIKADTVESLYDLLALNVREGTGVALKDISLNVGGKTGTAKKSIQGQYSHDKILTSFISVFPLENPQYLVFVLLDEPKSITDDPNQNSAFYNAAPLSARMIERLSTWKALVPYLRQEKTMKDMNAYMTK